MNESRNNHLSPWHQVVTRNRSESGGESGSHDWLFVFMFCLALFDGSFPMGFQNSDFLATKMRIVLLHEFWQIVWLIGSDVGKAYQLMYHDSK